MKKPRTPLSRTVGTVSHEITVPMTVTANDAAALQREAESDAVELRRLLVAGITTEDQYAAADEMLSGLARRRDALEKMRRSATDPLNAVVKTIGGWFKPARDAIDEGVGLLKTEMGAYRLRAAKAQAAADQNVACAAESGNNRALVRALEASSKAGAAGESGRARVAFRWKLKSANVAVMLTHDSTATPRFLVADAKALEAWANDVDRDEAGVCLLPGVTFERVANVGAKR